jgi:hypothetical protein
MSSSKYEAKMLSFQQVKSRSKTSDNALINDISDINAYSTPTQISSFVSSKMKEFIETQLSENKSIQSKTANP